MAKIQLEMSFEANVDHRRRRTSNDHNNSKVLWRGTTKDHFCEVWWIPPSGIGGDII